VPQTDKGPRAQVPARSLSTAAGMGEAALWLLPHRRWPLWVARVCFYLAMAAALFYPVQAAGDAEGRELFAVVTLTICLLLTVYLMWSHEAINRSGKEPRTRFMKAALTAGASCVLLAQFLAGGQADAAHVPKKVQTGWPLPVAPGGVGGLAIDHRHVALLPCITEKMTGAHQAPVSLIFLGSGIELLETFAAAGWHAAERITLRNALRAFGRGVTNRPYHCAPVFPCFLDRKLNDVAFQQTTPGTSSRRRHHSRWWLTDYTCGGRQVWVATASYDAGVGVGRLFPMPIHHIDPDLDTERDYTAHSLQATGRVAVTQEVRVTGAMMGRNAAGDRFYTEGTALVLA
jgi:hypothetical protein